jgi:dTDP-4-amino-4,6-dideoxygalactose transaminase
LLYTQDAALARRARMAIHHGEEPTDENYYAGERLYLHQLIGWNYRMTEVQGAIGSVQLSRLGGYLERRRELAALLTEALSGVRGVIPPYVDERAAHSFYKYIVRLDRDVLSVPVYDFVEALRAEGVPATRRYPTSIHEQPIIVEKRGFGRSTFPFGDDYPKPPAMPNAERVARDAIQVTVVNPSVSDQDVRDAATAIAKVAAAFAENEA